MTISSQLGRLEDRLAARVANQIVIILTDAENDAGQGFALENEDLIL